MYIEAIGLIILIILVISFLVGFIIWINTTEVNKKINEIYIPCLKKIKEKDDKKVNIKELDDIILFLKKTSYNKKIKIMECFTQNMNEQDEIINLKDFIYEINEIIIN